RILVEPADRPRHRRLAPLPSPLDLSRVDGRIPGHPVEPRERVVGRRGLRRQFAERILYHVLGRCAPLPGEQDQRRRVSVDQVGQLPGGHDISKTTPVQCFSGPTTANRPSVQRNGMATILNPLATRLERTRTMLAPRSVGLAVIFALAAASIARGEDPAEKKVELKDGDRIIFFGDSLTALAGQEAPKTHVTKGYVRLVRETLKETHKDKSIDVDWVATGGHTVPDLLKRVDKDVIAKKPTIVVIQIGCNDARRIPKETFKAGLEELIDKLRKADIRVIQCTLTSVGERQDGTNKDDPKLDEFAEIERQVAKAKDVALNDLRKAFVAHWRAHNPDNKASGILTYDGNHFNDAGHKFVAEQMLKMFK